MLNCAISPPFPLVIPKLDGAGDAQEFFENVRSKYYVYNSDYDTSNTNILDHAINGISKWNSMNTCSFGETSSPKSVDELDRGLGCHTFVLASFDCHDYFYDMKDRSFFSPTDPEKLIKHNFQPTIIPTSDIPNFNEWLESRSHDICNAGVYFIAHGSKVIVSNDEIDACKVQF